MNTADKFHNKNGTYTAYALACGYIQKAFDGAESVQLYQESGAYHVKHIHDNGMLDRDSWNVFDTLTEARQDYRVQVRRYLGAGGITL